MAQQDPERGRVQPQAHLCAEVVAPRLEPVHGNDECEALTGRHRCVEVRVGADESDHLHFFVRGRKKTRMPYSAHSRKCVTGQVAQGGAYRVDHTSTGLVSSRAQLATLSCAGGVPRGHCAVIHPPYKKTTKSQAQGRVSVRPSRGGDKV